MPWTHKWSVKNPWTCVISLFLFKPLKKYFDLLFQPWTRPWSSKLMKLTDFLKEKIHAGFWRKIRYLDKAFCLYFLLVEKLKLGRVGSIKISRSSSPFFHGHGKKNFHICWKIGPYFLTCHYSCCLNWHPHLDKKIVTKAITLAFFFLLEIWSRKKGEKIEQFSKWILGHSKAWKTWAKNQFTYQKGKWRNFNPLYAT